MTYYDTLGIAETATAKEIKQAYRSLSLKYHPDHNSSPDATEMMSKINEAYEILKDEGKRKLYDEQLHPQPYTGPMKHPFFDRSPHSTYANDLFNMFHSNIFDNLQGNIHVFHSDGNVNIHRTFRHIRKPEPIKMVLVITLEECYNGVRKEINYTRWDVKDNEKIDENITTVIDIPKGMYENECVILTNQGHKINEEVKGDVKINIKIENKTPFKRVGDDLYLKKTVSLKDALCGIDFDFNHISGNNLSLKSSLQDETNMVIYPGSKKVLPNLGMIRNGKMGNLTIEFDVEFPKQMSKEKLLKIQSILE
jgi:DnaJ-class molecular chaperone